MINTNQNMSIGNAVKLLGIKEIGTFPAPYGESVKMYYQGDKVVTETYDRFNELKGKYTFDSYEEACYEIAGQYF